LVVQERFVSEVIISTSFLESPERMQRTFQPPFCYVVNNLSQLHCESIHSKGSREVIRVVEIET